MASVDNILAHPFPTLNFTEKQKIISSGRAIPQVNIVQELPRKSGKPTYRKFKRSYFDLHQWLTACPKRQSLFCFPCLLFSVLKSVWRSGYSNLNNFGKDAVYHEATKAHKSAVLALRRFGQEPRIDLQLSQARAEEIRRHNDLVRKKSFDYQKFNRLCHISWYSRTSFQGQT